jgi:hypothetical protein
MITVGMTEGLPDDVERELAALERASMAVGAGVASAVVADGSPSRDRLVRIAAMIRDAELATPVLSGRHRRAHEVRLIPLAPRRNRARRRTETVVELAS